MPQQLGTVRCAGHGGDHRVRRQYAQDLLIFPVRVIWVKVLAPHGFHIRQAIGFHLRQKLRFCRPAQVVIVFMYRLQQLPHQARHLAGGGKTAVVILVKVLDLQHIEHIIECKAPGVAVVQVYVQKIVGQQHHRGQIPQPQPVFAAVKHGGQAVIICRVTLLKTHKPTVQPGGGAVLHGAAHSGDHRLGFRL